MTNIFWPVGGGDEIGASSYFLQLEDQKILLDAGVRFQDELAYPEYEILYQNNVLDGLWELSAILLSHAHLDHTGCLPWVAQHAGGVPIYATAATLDLLSLLLNNAREESIACTDYKKDLLEQAIAKTNIVKPFEPFWINDIQVTFFPSGHILGACAIFLETKDLHVLFTGDFTNFDQCTALALDLPDHLQVDVLITESTYGYSNRVAPSQVDTERLVLVRNIAHVLEHGKVLIPAFAIGRSQEIARVLAEAMLAGSLSPCSVYVAGLAIQASDIYEKYGIPIFNEHIQRAPPDFYQHVESFHGIILCSSGMLKENTFSAKYAQKMLSDPQSAIFFTGYLDEESPGKRLNALKEHQGKKFYIQNTDVLVQANISTFQLSAHTDCQGIRRLIQKYKPKKVIFVHGFPKNGGRTNIFYQTLEEFGSEIDIYQACNGNPIVL